MPPPRPAPSGDASAPAAGGVSAPVVTGAHARPAPGTQAPPASGPAPVVLERRRLRSWEGSTDPPRHPWRILVRYSLVKLVRTWWLSTLLVVVGVYLVVLLGVASYAFSSGSGIPGELGMAGPAMLLAPACVFLLLVGAPSFAEDLRVNAHVFYFSRPLHRDQYIWGKAVFLGGLLGAMTLAPMLILAVMLLALGIPLTGPPGYIDTAAELDRWRASHIDTFADGLYSAGLAFTALAALTFFLATACLLASSYTRRGWHAGVAFVALLYGWSILGAFAGQLTRTAYGQLFGPAGWIQLLFVAPYGLRYDLPAMRLGGGYGSEYIQDQEAFYAGAPAAIAVAYGLLAAFSLLFLGLTVRRVRRQEANL